MGTHTHTHTLTGGLAVCLLQEFILRTFNAFCELVALNLYNTDWSILKLLGN